MTEPQFGASYTEILRAALLAESEGLTSFARSDHWHWSGTPAPATDAFATLAGLARETTSIRLCVLVSPVTFRHPAVIAKNAATIDSMSAGRLDLGIGTGWNRQEHDALGLDFPDWDRRYEMLEEAVSYLESAFHDPSLPFAGKYFRLDGEVLPKPGGLRLVIGGSGPERTPRFAGRHADEYNVIVTTPEEVAVRVTAMRTAAGGRRVEVTAMGPAFVGKTQGEYQAILEGAAGRRGMSADSLEAEWATDGTLHGTTGQVRDQIAALADSGVERIYLQWLDLADHQGMAAMLDAVRA